MAEGICVGLIALASVAYVSSTDGEFGLTPQKFLSAIPDDWQPPLPPFMDDASEESQQEFQLIITNWDSSVDTKQRQIAELIAKQPEHVRRAYEDFQAVAALQPFSLEQELEKIRLEAEGNSESSSTANGNGVFGVVEPVDGKREEVEQATLVITLAGEEIAEEGITTETGATTTAPGDISDTEKHESL